MNNRVIGIVGGALLIVGIFLPLISISGIGVSGFTVVTNAPIGDSWYIILLALCGVGGLLLALTNNYRALLAPGLIALGMLIYMFVKWQSGMASMGGPGGAAAGEDSELAQQIASAVSIGMGVYVMAAGAIVMIVAGVLKNKPTSASTGYGAPPYTPGR
jgi:hypothetical protein